MYYTNVSIKSLILLWATPTRQYLHSVQYGQILHAYFCLSLTLNIYNSYTRINITICDCSGQETNTTGIVDIAHMTLSNWQYFAEY